MTNRAKLTGTFAIVMLMLAACAVNATIQFESSLPPISTTSTPKTTPSNTPSATVRATATVTQVPKTSTPIVTTTPTVRWQVQVIEIVPAIQRVEREQERQVNSASFVDDTKVVYSFVTGGSDSAERIIHWSGYDISTQSEISATAPVKYDDSFWKRNHVEKIAFHPELEGYFSPSGKYVIYNVWYGSVFDAGSRTEIWVAETKGQRKVKVCEFGYSNVYIHHATWYNGETKVLFSASYEGPAEFYVTDIPSRKTVLLSEVTQFDGATENYGRLSPDGKEFAVVDLDRRLLLVPMDNGPVKVLEEAITSVPVWSNDGRQLYYWWGSDKNNWHAVTELRVYDLPTETKSTVVDKPSLVQGFRDYEGDNINLAPEYYLGAAYAVSPHEDQILLWGGWLYGVALHSQP